VSGAAAPVYAVASAAEHRDACCCESYGCRTWQDGLTALDDVRLCARRDCPRPLYRGSSSRVREVRSRELAAMTARDPYGGWPHLTPVDVQGDLLDLLGGAS
jgi:hypothetical protein